MYKLPLPFFLLLIIFVALQCGSNSINAATDQEKNSPTVDKTTESIPYSINPTGKTLEERIPSPNGYQRTTIQTGSFAEYLRTIPLKPQASLVKYYDGREKPSSGVYTAVVDLDIGKKDLHQCADAVMRLRAEYLWQHKKYDDIHFNFTNGFRVDYSEWMTGKRILVKGNSTKWNNTIAPSNSYKDFWIYMETIFMYAGTASLEKELKSVEMNDMKIGDVFIQGGYPGHAIIVMDMAIDKKSNKKLFILAQSYMPAQETQILINPNDTSLSPWYLMNETKNIRTPEWTFNTTDLKRFQ